MSPVNIRASLGPCELHAEVTPILRLVFIFAVSRKTLALSKTEATGTALIPFLGRFFYRHASILLRA